MMVNIKWMGLAFFAVFSANAAEPLAATKDWPDLLPVCFESKMDMLIYEQFGNAAPPPGPPEDVHEANAGWFWRAAEHGPARMKTIHIILKETQKDGMIYLDATETTTPGPNPMFVWGDTPNSWDPKLRKISSKSGVPGTKGSMLLTVVDKACRLKAEKRITFTYQ